MNQKIYQIDAFSDAVFKGNPAAICPLTEWLSDELMQKIAMENNLAETAFYVREGDQYHIRWFTPTIEVDLCGHATLAAAYVLFNLYKHSEDIIHFYSHRSGPLSVTKVNELLTLNFPTDILEEIPLSADLTNCFDSKPIRAFKGKTDYMLVFEKEEQIQTLRPDIYKITRLNARGIIVTGSAHTSLTPYWAKETGKSNFTAKQLSARGGYLECRLKDERVEISGKASLYLAGEIFLD